MGRAGVLAVQLQQLQPGTLGIATGVGLEDFALGGLDATGDRVEQLAQFGDLGSAEGRESCLGDALQLENGVADVECVGDGRSGWPGGPENGFAFRNSWYGILFLSAYRTSPTSQTV